ncbi:MAG: sodium:proton antiporter [Puniceicoccaceae bacterium]|nr:MAG: sodium:proton antiporter [Puniceicoccaceae bacterium]
MIELILRTAFFILIFSVFLGFYRMAMGPTVVDRILAFDAVVVCAVGKTIVLSRLWGTPVFLELILIISSLGFFATVAFVYFLQRTRDLPGASAPANRSTTRS